MLLGTEQLSCVEVPDSGCNSVCKGIGSEQGSAPSALAWPLLVVSQLWAGQQGVSQHKGQGGVLGEGYLKVRCGLSVPPHKRLREAKQGREVLCFLGPTLLEKFLK